MTLAAEASAMKRALRKAEEASKGSGAPLDPREMADAVKEVADLVTALRQLKVCDSRFGCRRGACISLEVLPSPFLLLSRSVAVSPSQPHHVLQFSGQTTTAVLPTSLRRRTCGLPCFRRSSTSRCPSSSSRCRGG
jgi:hypothetical protein